MQLTDCECTGPGWCERHQCHKPAPMFLLCRSQLAYFRLWEEGKGPGQQAESRRSKLKPPCAHRQGELRAEPCASCNGQVRIKVFRCSMHRECTLSRTLENVACCDTCDNYFPITTG